MRSETITRRAFVKTAAIHYMSSNQGFPTSVDIRNEMQAMGVEKGTKNLSLLKKDLNFVADDLVAIIQQKDQLASDGQTKLIPDSVFEMTLKFYNEIKADNKKSYEHQLDVIKKERDEVLQDKKDRTTREKAITTENAQLQGELETLKHELTQERISIVDVNQLLEAAHKEIKIQKRGVADLQEENQALQLSREELKVIFDF
ncbi:MAG: hypothetical protein KZQ56_13115 [gamma proteobacterium symbiont of Lucinoma myriamae]|nr:hypothetical protein [gamma proteobacterium symbiont of Lucinoma myriamae]MCU7833491.1 hypothetical protein [gamma proteobacterium symbiont of Lucinoma myriamae]